jgi:hypothetical protein
MPFFLIAGMSGIEPSILEAAIVDGATSWQRARHIVLPLLRPVFAYISITAAAGSLVVFEVPYIMISNGGPAGKGWFFITYIAWMAFDQSVWAMRQLSDGWSFSFRLRSPSCSSSCSVLGRPGKMANLDIAQRVTTSPREVKRPSSVISVWVQFLALYGCSDSSYWICLALFLYVGAEL